MDSKDNNINNNLPFEIKDVERQLNEELLQYCKTELDGFVQVGPKRYFLPLKYKQEAYSIYNAEVRPDDTFLLGYPRSGTTWSQELVWLVANDLNYERAVEWSMMKRFPSLENTLIYHPTMLERHKKLNEQNEHNLKVLEFASMSVAKKMAAAPSPRFFKTHIPLSLLPPKLLDVSRVLFVARDPRDVAVSYYHLSRSRGEFDGDFKFFWNFFVRDLRNWSPFFENIKEAWDKRDHPHMLFWFYEDMIRDLPAVIRRVSAFYNKTYSEVQIQLLCQHLDINNFKNNKSVNNVRLTEIGLLRPDEQGFIRKGKSGGWREYFDEEMQSQAAHWIKDNLRGTDLRFPGMDDLDIE